MIWWLKDWMIGWRNDWIIGWMNGWMIEWLEDWIQYIHISMFEWPHEWLKNLQECDHSEKSPTIEKKIESQFW